MIFGSQVGRIHVLLRLVYGSVCVQQQSAEATVSAARFQVSHSANSEATHHCKVSLSVYVNFKICETVQKVQHLLSEESLVCVQLPHVTGLCA